MKTIGFPIKGAPNGRLLSRDATVSKSKDVPSLGPVLFGIAPSGITVHTDTQTIERGLLTSSWLH